MISGSYLILKVFKTSLNMESFNRSCNDINGLRRKKPFLNFKLWVTRFRENARTRKLYKTDKSKFYYKSGFCDS